LLTKSYKLLGFSLFSAGRSLSCDLIGLSPTYLEM